MRLLYVTEQVPNRDPVRGNGSSMIPYEVIRALPSEVEVTLLTYDEAYAVPDEIVARCREVVLLPLAPLPAGRWGLLRMVWSAASPATWERVTPTVRRRVRALAAAHDVTLIHGGRIAALAHAAGGPVVIQAVDPWSAVVRMEARVVHGWRSGYRRVKAAQALWLERCLPPGARLLTVGRSDAEAWSTRVGREVHAIANGVHATPRATPPPTVPTVCFVGSLSYLPNRESTEVLVREIAPLVWQQVPDARFVIAGRHPAPQVLALAGTNVEVLANVESVDEVFHAATVAAFPDRNGVGIRNSVTESLAAGTPVVATPAAAREQPAHPLLTVTGTTEQFVTAVVDALRSPRTPEPVGGATAFRSWAEVATDYLRECRAAVTGQGA